MNTLRQLAILFGFGLAGEVVSLFLPVKAPASVVAPLLMLAAFLLEWIKPEQVKEVTMFFYQNMALLFIVPAVGVMRNMDLVRHALFPLFLMVVVTTMLTFAASFLSAKLVRILIAKRGDAR